MIQDILGARGTQVDPMTLELLATKASRRYLDEGVPLTAAVQELVSGHPGLNEQHLRRIVEKTNNLTFQELFDKSEDKNLHFDIADPDAILGRRAAAPEVTAPTDISSYREPPTAPAAVEKQASEFLEDDFGTGHSDPRQDVYDQHLRLERAQQILEDSYGEIAAAKEEAMARFQKLAKQEVLTGQLGLMLSALEKVAESPAYCEWAVHALVSPLIEKLAQTGMLPADLGLEKTAGHLVNPKHPLLVTYSAMEKLSADERTTELALRDVRSALAETRAFLKTAMIGTALGVLGKGMTLISLPETVVKQPLAAARSAAMGMRPEIQEALAERIR